MRPISRLLHAALALGVVALLVACTADLQDLDQCRAYAHVFCQKSADCGSATAVDACITTLTTVPTTGRSTESPACTLILSANDPRQCLDSIANLTCSTAGQTAAGCGFTVALTTH